MLGDTIGSFCAGTILGISLGSPVEWTIHKYLLHASPKLRRRHSFIENAATGHNDNHHEAYKAPEHYYRDITNEHEIIHFAKGDVGIIAVSAAVVGAALERAHALLINDYRFDDTSGAFVAGVLAGTMVYYGGYEFFHHQMHVLGKRRLAINRVLGDTIQGGTIHRDGKLRLSKPLLDDICTTLEAQVDHGSKQEELSSHIPYAPSLVQRLNHQIQENMKYKDAPIVVKAEQRSNVLAETYAVLAAQEKDFLKNFNIQERIGYAFQRRLQRTLRTSPIFKKIDNHHFLHHRKYGKNLNVLFPLMDYLKGTKEVSTPAVLEEKKDYWICPNSPDEQVFQRKERRSASSYKNIQPDSSVVTRAR